MRNYLLCLGLIGCLGMQNTAFAAPVGGAASLIAAPEPSRTIENVDYYHHHHHHHHRHYHHHHP